MSPEISINLSAKVDFPWSTCAIIEIFLIFSLVIIFIKLLFSTESLTMANNNSQKKRNRQNIKRNLANKSVKSELKTAINDAEDAINTDAENKNEVVNEAIRKIDKAYSKGVIKSNYRNRKKSKLTS